jgi:methionyl-tRNA formyltransferase
MKIVYFSKGIRGVRCLEAILETGADVQAVVGVDPEPELEMLTSPRGIETLYPDRINTTQMVKKLKDFQADLFILSGYNKILRPLIFEIPPLGTINLHGGKLPEYRGAAPINWQIINGESTGGCSIIFVDEGIDTGDIILQERYPITQTDTHASVLEKTLEIFPRLLVKVIDDLKQGKICVEKQDPLEGCYYTRRYPRDSIIDWQGMNDIQIHNLVRGMRGPYPEAFSFRGQEKIEILRTSLLKETITGMPGRIPIKRESAVIALAKNRGLLIEEISVNRVNVVPADYFRIGDDFSNTRKG